MTDRRSGRVHRVLGALFAVGVAVRMGPLHWSSLPFNPDGIVYAGQVRLAVATGELPLFRMPVDDVHFTALLTMVATITGEPALRIAQPAVAVIGTVPVLVAAAITRRLVRRLRADHHTLAVVVTGGLLAVSGPVLHRTMAVDEQTLGLLLVPLGVVAYARARRTGRPALYASAALCAVVLPATHNLDTVVFGLALVGWTALDRGGTARSRLLGVAVAAGYWIYAVGYFRLADRLTLAYIVQQGRLTDELDLFVAWVILGVFLLAALRRGRSRRLRVVGGFTACVWFGLLVANGIVAVFPGLPMTPPAVLLALCLLALPTIAAAWALPEALGDRPDGVAVVALAAAVVVVIGFSLTASLTPPYFNSIYRVQTFAHLPWAVLAGVAVGVLVSRGFVDGRRDRRRRWMAPGVGVLILVCAAASAPIAFAGVDTLSYKGVTEEAEFAGMDHAVQTVPGTWSGDDHLVRIAAYHSRDEPAVREPVATWIRGGPPPSCPVVSQRSWTTVGAQQYPAATEAVAPGRYDAFLRSRQVVYDAGTADRVVVSTPFTGTTQRC